MKRKLANALVGISMVGALAACTQEAPQTPPLANETISDGDKALITDTFEAGVHYWMQKGIGGVATTHVAWIEGSNTFTCDATKDEPTAVFHVMDETAYCPSKNTIVVSAMDVNARDTDPDGQVLNRFIIAHEIGHAIQQAQGRLAPIYHNADAQKRLELQANCYAGDFMNYARPADIAAVAAHLETFPTDPGHGTNAEQATAFLFPLHGGNC